jgi:hypothetical protein
MRLFAVLLFVPVTLVAQSVEIPRQPQIAGARRFITSESLQLAPIPPDPHEPVTGVVQPVTTQAERSSALALLSRAKQVHQFHLRGTPPYKIVANFTASSGSGTLTETWLNGQRWHWSGNVGSAAAVRIGADGLHFASPEGGAIPPAVHVLRNAIFWAAAADGAPVPGQIRSSAILFNGRQTTCLLFSDIRSVDTAAGGRSWDDEEYCIDDASGLLQVHSISPGTFVEYSYKGSQFHSRSIPSGITIYSAGVKVMDAQITMADAGSPDPSLFAPTPEMLTYGPVGTGQLPSRTLWQVPADGVLAIVKPVIVHASVDGQGNVVECELSSASDPALVQGAMDLVKRRPFPPTGNTRQIYVDVRFVPASQ